MIVIHVPGQMLGKGRAKFRRFPGFVQAYSDAKTVSMENWVKSCAVQQGATESLVLGPVEVTIEISQVPPASWSNRKQASALAGAILPTGKPDADNTAKLVCDALNKLVWKDDAQITRLVVSKRYAETAETFITVAAAPLTTVQPKQESVPMAKAAKKSPPGPKAKASSASAPPTTPEPDDDAPLTADSLVASGTNYLVGFLQKEGGTPWNQRTESDQARVINRARAQMAEMVGDVIELVKADGLVPLSGKVKKFEKTADKCQAVITFDPGDSCLQHLIDAVGQIVTLTSAAGVDRYSRTGTIMEPVPDQPPLGLPAPDHGTNGAGAPH